MIRRKLQASMSLDRWIAAALEAEANRRRLSVSWLIDTILADWAAKGSTVTLAARSAAKSWRKIGINATIHADVVDALDAAATQADIPASWIANDVIGTWMIENGIVDEKTKKIIKREREKLEE